MDLALPAEMVAGITAFKDFYEKESSHRKLTWVYTQVGLNLFLQVFMVPLIAP
jgi:hypothetical protein